MSEKIKLGVNRLNKKNFWSTFGVPIALVVICVVLAFNTKMFLSVENIFNILRTISIIAVAAIGSTFILISGGIDVSVSAVMACAGVMCVALMKTTGMGFLPAVIISVGAGALIGVCNGLIITKIKIPAFIATLGTMQIIRGATFIYTQGYSVYGENMPTAFEFVGRGYFGVVPVPVVIMIALFVIFWFVANKTILGQHVYAVGSNEKSSYLFGINVTKTRILVYMIGGITAAIAGILFAARLQSAQAGAATGMEFDILTAAVLGGVSIYGGKGKIERTLLGALVIGVINNGMTLMNISSFYQMVASGSILIIALALDRINSD
ncbi:MAG: ABC transporter permease [Christensenellaceae bacterium]